MATAKSKYGYDDLGGGLFGIGTNDGNSVCRCIGKATACELVRKLDAHDTMLAACKEALTRFHVDGWPLNAANRDVIEMLNAAITKAEH